MESSGNGLQFLNRLGSRCGSVVHVQIRSRNQVGTLILYASLSEHQLSLWTPLDTPGCLACHCLVPCCASRGSRVMSLRVPTLLTSMSSQLACSPPPPPCWSSSFHSQAINPGNVRNTPEPRGLTLSCVLHHPSYHPPCKRMPEFIDESELYWFRRCSFLHSTGYRLRPKFYPDFVASTQPGLLSKAELTAIHPV